MKVASFLVNHDTMMRGVYVSRRDTIGAEVLTTFDIRVKTPNREPVLDNPAIHTLEHLMAVYLRGESGDWAEKVVYIGPMGCRTGMYLIMKGALEPADILPLLKEMFAFAARFDAPVPATTSIECGNYLDHNLTFAKWEAAKFLSEVLDCITPAQMVYPA